MSILSVHDIQGFSAYNNTVRVPSGHSLDVVGSLSVSGALNMPTWADANSRPTANLTVGQIGFNIADNQIEIYNGVNDDNEPIWITYAGSAPSAAGFPQAYQSMIDGWTGNKYWVDPTGSNSGSGGESTPWADPKYAVETATGPAMIIVNPGTYQLSAPMYTDGSGGFTQKVYYDGGKEIKLVCAPGQVKILGPGIGGTSDPGQRDYNMLVQTNASSHIYGAIFYRDNGGRTTNYNVAMFGYPTPGANVGDASNTFFREINATGWSLHYDNPSNHTWTATNCSFMGAWHGSNYSGGGSSTCVNCAGQGSWGSSGTNTNPLNNASFSNDFSTSSSTQGVYGGTYAWDAAQVTQTL